jgi:hypothetical protein
MPENRIKIFYASTIEPTGFDDVEKRVNDWFCKHAHDHEVVNLFTNSFPTTFSVTIHYVIK